MNEYRHLKREGSGESKGLLSGETQPEDAKMLLDKMKEISTLISNVNKFNLLTQGAITFLKQEYLFLMLFLSLFAILIFFTAEIDDPVIPKGFTTCAFLVGGITSILSGFIGMKIAVYTNVRTTKECAESISNGFVVAYRGG